MVRCITIWRVKWIGFLFTVLLKDLCGYQLCGVASRGTGRGKAMRVEMTWRRITPMLLVTASGTQRVRMYARPTLIQIIGVLMLLLWSRRASAIGVGA